MLDPDDPLIPAPDPEPWLTLDLDQQPATLARLQEAVGDYYAFHQLVLPAFDDQGRPVPPPDEHVLDHLARALDLVDEETTMLRPSPDTVAVVDSLPTCDRCRRPRLARYDALLERFGANLCTRCFRSIGHGHLGSGKAQYLLATAEVTSPVRAAVDELRSRHGIGSYWADEPDDPAWVRAYRTCGFGGPDPTGVMARELYGISIWAVPDAAKVVQIDRSSSPDEFLLPEDGPPGDYRVPMEWTAVEVRHFLHSAYAPSPGHGTDPADPLGEPLDVSEARTLADLDAREFPVMITDGVRTQPPREMRFPVAHARGYADAERCAKHSRDAGLVGRLAREHPQPAIKVQAVANPVCPPDVLLDCCTGVLPDLRRTMLLRDDLTDEMLTILAQAAIEGPSSHQGDRSFIDRMILHPGCPEEALPVLVDRIKAAPTRERVELAAGAHALTLDRRQLIATLLLSDARRSKVASAVIDALIGVDGAACGTRMPDEDMLGWLVEHPDRTIRRLSRERVHELGLQEAFLG